MKLAHWGDSQDCLDGLQVDDQGMCFNIVKAWSLCATLGDEPCFVFEELSFLIPLLGKYRLICNGYDAGRFVSKSPSPHLVELVELGIYGAFPFFLATPEMLSLHEGYGSHCPGLQQTLPLLLPQFRLLLCLGMDCLGICNPLVYPWSFWALSDPWKYPQAFFLG